MSLSGPFEVRLLALERRQVAVDDALRTLRIQAISVQQRLWDDEASSGLYRSSGAAPPPPTPNTTVTGTLQGCDGTGNSGATVVINTAGTGSATTTVTTNGSGVYSGTIYLAADAVIFISYTATNARFASVTISASITHGTTNTLLTRKLAGATGYHCSARCALPLADSFDMTDTDTGATDHVMTWTGAGGGAGGWRSVGYNSSSGLGLSATLDANSGAFSIGTSGGVLTASNCTPPITLTFNSGPRQWVITNA